MSKKLDSILSKVPPAVTTELNKSDIAHHYSHQEKQERILHPSETLNFAATEIQKIVRGWNVRKKPLLMKMMEWYEFSSTPSSNADSNSSISSNNYDESIV